MYCWCILWSHILLKSCRSFLFLGISASFGNLTQQNFQPRLSCSSSRLLAFNWASSAWSWPHRAANSLALGRCWTKTPVSITIKKQSLNWCWKTTFTSPQQKSIVKTDMFLPWGMWLNTKTTKEDTTLGTHWPGARISELETGRNLDLRSFGCAFKHHLFFWNKMLVQQEFQVL